MRGLVVGIPGRGSSRIRHLVLDVNGTLTVGGDICNGVKSRLRRLSESLEVVLVTSDTRGTARELAGGLGVSVHVVADGDERERKAEIVRGLGPTHTAAIGNGANDASMLQTAALGLAVIQGEGAAWAAMCAADAVFVSVCDALDSLLDPPRLMATLRE